MKSMLTYAATLYANVACAACLNVTSVGMPNARLHHRGILTVTSVDCSSNAWVLVKVMTMESPTLLLNTMLWRGQRCSTDGRASYALLKKEVVLSSPEPDANSFGTILSQSCTPAPPN